MKPLDIFETVAFVPAIALFEGLVYFGVANIPDPYATPIVLIRLAAYSAIYFALRRFTKRNEKDILEAAERPTLEGIRRLILGNGTKRNKR